MRDFDLAEFLPYRLAVLAERVSRRLSVEYEVPHGLTVAEWRVLVHLLRARQVSVREIHESVNLEKPRVSRAVSRLEVGGLVRKGVSDGDSRLVAISLTDAGERTLSDILPKALGVEARILSCLTKSECAALYLAFEKIHAVLDSDPKAKRRVRADTAPRDVEAE